MRQRASIGVTRQSGFTLIELMVGVVLGLLLLVALSAAFVGSSTARREVQLSAEVIENGRYGLDILSRELAQAGFYGTLATPLGTGTFNDVCSTAVVDASNNDWAHSLEIYVSGLNHTATSPGCLTSVRKSGTDAIFIQRASTCRVGEAGCATETDKQAYLQVSECGSEYSTNPYRVDVGLAVTFTLKAKDCTATSTEKRRLIRRIYFVNTNDQLQFMDITPEGAQTPETLVDGIEQMQIEYAIDGDGDGSIDSYNSTPATTDWPGVIGARIWLLAKSAETSRNTAPSMTFTMGDCLFTSLNALCNVAPGSPAGVPQLKRRVYHTFVTFTTPKLRRES